MPPTGFEPAIPASQRPHTHALDRAYIEVGERKVNKTSKLNTLFTQFIYTN
jgi:hypothetical protein